MRDGFVAAASAKVWNGVAFLPLPPGAAPALTKTPQLSATTVGSLVGSPAQPGLPPPVPPVPPSCPPVPPVPPSCPPVPPSAKTAVPGSSNGSTRSSYAVPHPTAYAADAPSRTAPTTAPRAVFIDILVPVASLEGTRHDEARARHRHGWRDAHGAVRRRGPPE